MQNEFELTRPQLIAKVEAEVDRFLWKEGRAAESAVIEPSHAGRQDVSFEICLRTVK